MTLITLRIPTDDVVKVARYIGFAQGTFDALERIDDRNAITQQGIIEAREKLEMAHKIISEGITRKEEKNE